MITIKQLWRFCRAKIDSSYVDSAQNAIYLEVSPDKRYKPICAYCSSRITIHQHEERVLRDIPVWGFSVFIRAHYRKGRCPQCGKIVVEHLEYTKPGLRMTNRLAEYIVGLGRKMSDADTARFLALSWDVVHRIHYEALFHKYKDMDYGTPRLLGVDEIARKRGHNYATVIADIENGRVLSLEKDRTVDSLKNFYKKLTIEQRENIEAVAMDGWKPYIRATKEMLPDAEIVMDYFHLVKRYHAEVIDKIRIMTYNELKGLEKKIIKGTRFILYKNREKLDDHERTKLDEILGANRALYIAYTLKELIHSMFHTDLIDEAKDRINMFLRMAVESNICALKNFAGKLVKYAEYIINHAKYKISTSIVEGMNNKINNIKRRAYGIKDLQFLKLLTIDAFQ